MARSRLLSPLRFARRMGLYRGLLGGSRGWMFVGGVAFGGRIVRRFMSRTPEVVLTERLRPGQPISLEAIAAPTRGQRRASRRAV